MVAAARSAYTATANESPFAGFRLLRLLRLTVQRPLAMWPPSARLIAGQELNIAQSARGRAALGCLGVALFVLSKVTAGIARNER